MALDLVRLLKAAAEPTRLRLLNLLREGDICVCDLQAVLGLPQYQVSRHLAELRHAGLVTDEREGQRVVYSLAATPSPELKGLQRLLKHCCPLDEVLRNDLERFRRAVIQGACQLNSTKGNSK
ncbi:MAG TPA: metalloregulator ArsR/SmtB family transcription factor [Candidatus Xenobia bacterium]|nr:metalloregulator ArsR/SmtB family transcription factor [Candidatus Xenobia bacterium]